jgi:hypothetical protein
MATDQILALLISERDKLTAAIEALQDPTITKKTPDSKTPETVGPTAPVKRKLSAAGRRAIIAATKKRWAAIKAAKAAAAVPAVAPKPATAKAPAAAKHKAAPAKDAAFRKKMSETMKKAWAARKKKAAAKTK